MEQDISVGLVVEWLTRCSHTAETPGSIPGEPINTTVRPPTAKAVGGTVEPQLQRIPGEPTNAPGSAANSRPLFAQEKAAFENPLGFACAKASFRRKLPIISIAMQEMPGVFCNQNAYAKCRALCASPEPRLMLALKRIALLSWKARAKGKNKIHASNAL